MPNFSELINQAIAPYLFKSFRMINTNNFPWMSNEFGLGSTNLLTTNEAANQVSHQTFTFFMAEEVSWNMDASIDISSTANYRNTPQGKISEFFSWIILKPHFKWEIWPIDKQNLGVPKKFGHYFWFSEKKKQGGSPTSYTSIMLLIFISENE